MKGRAYLKHPKYATPAVRKAREKIWQAENRKTKKEKWT